NPNVGIIIQGHCALPSNPADFKITTGTYTFGTGNSFGTDRTFASGEKTDNGTAGTSVYNFNTQEFIFIDNGTFTVGASGSNYTITTNFSGIDYKTGARVNNIQYQYTGPISIINEPTPTPSCTPPFGSFCESNFTATGTAVSSDTPGSWTGKITPLTSGQKNYYRISQWGDLSVPVYCNYTSSKIIVDGSTKLIDEDIEGYSIYFKAYIIAQNTWTEVSNHEAKYNTSTRTLDFSGSYNGSSVIVGIVGINSSKQLVQLTTYRNAKLVLSSSSSAPRLIPGITKQAKLSSEQMQTGAVETLNASSNAGITKENILRLIRQKASGAILKTNASSETPATNSK
ncbi:MAG: hypothetical protein LBC47_07360, partial [Tannerella sp.]|nr:hypothetical protein [Tannerella sp.]